MIKFLKEINKKISSTQKATQEIDKKAEEYINTINQETQDYKEKVQEHLQENQKKLQMLSEKINCADSDTDMEFLQEQINAMLSVVNSNTSEQINEEIAVSKLNSAKIEEE